MKFRDDYLASFDNKANVLRASGLVNLTLNATLTISPLLIGLASKELGVWTSGIILLGVQVATYLGLQSLRHSLETSSSLTRKIQAVGSKAIVACLLVSCASLILILHATQKRKGEEQAELWAKSASGSLIPDLIRGDLSAINEKLGLVTSIHLFNSFAIFDVQNSRIASIVPNLGSDQERLAIKDEAGATWGYYSWTIDPMSWWSNLMIVIPAVILVFSVLGLIFRYQIMEGLGREIHVVREFIGEIEQRAEVITSEKGRSSSSHVDGHDSEEILRLRTVVEKLADKATDRERRLIEAEAVAATEHNKKVSQLYRQVAHDIRSPLSALTMTLAQLDSLSIERRTLIEGAVTRINDIASDLLSKSNDLPITSQIQVAADQDVGSAIRQIISEKQAQYASRENVIFYVNLGTLQIVVTQADCKRLMRILSNLIDNSIDAMVNVSGRIEIYGKVENGQIGIQVVDDGVGIPEELIPRIGEEGFTMKSGHGLGIFSAKEYLRSIGGDLHITSKVGRGTCVTIWLAAPTQTLS